MDSVSILYTAKKELIPVRYLSKRKEEKQIGGRGEIQNGYEKKREKGNGKVVVKKI